MVLATRSGKIVDTHHIYLYLALIDIFQSFINIPRLLFSSLGEVHELKVLLNPGYCFAYIMVNAINNIISSDLARFNDYLMFFIVYFFLSKMHAAVAVGL